MKLLKLALIISSVAVADNYAAYSFIGLGHLPGGSSSISADISADGSTVVGYGNSSMGPQGFRWTEAEGMVGLGDFEGGEFSSMAHGVSADGSVIVGNGSDTNGVEAFRWTLQEGLIGIGQFEGGLNSRAYGVSSNGMLIVGQANRDHGTVEAFRWTPAEGFVGLGYLPGNSNYSSHALDISADGSIIVGGNSASFYWTETEGLVEIGSGTSIGISADGTTIVGVTSVAFKWTEDLGLIELERFDATSSNSRALDTSADGSITVGYCYGTNGQEACVWSELFGIQSLKDILTNKGVDTGAWQFSEIRAISDDGTRVAGKGVNPAGASEAFIADIYIPTPEEATVSIFPAIEIVWPSVSGQTYRVQYSTNVASSGSWRNLSDSIYGDGLTNTYFDTTRGGTERFYRLISD